MGLILSVSSRGSTTFADHSSVIGVSGAPLKCYDRAAKTVVSLWASNCDSSSPDAGVSLALSSSCNYLILVLAAARSAWGFKTVIVSLSKVLEGPVGALLATVFWGIVVGVVVILSKFFRGHSLYIL